MSLAERFARAPVHTLNLAVRANTLECCVTEENGRGQNWLGQYMLELPLTDAQELPALLHQLAAMLKGLQSKGRLPGIDRLRVVVSDNWLAVADVPWSPALKHPAQAEPYMRGQLQESGFAPAENGLLRFDDAPFGEPRLIVLYPDSLLAACKELTDQLQAELVSLLPLSLAAWSVAKNAGYQGAEAVAVLDDALLLIVCAHPCSAARPVEVVVRSGSGAFVPTEADLDTAWRRMVLRQPRLGSVVKLPLLDLRRSVAERQAPAAPFELVNFPDSEGILEGTAALHLLAGMPNARSFLDAVEARRKPSASRWLAAGIAALLALGAFFHLLQVHEHFGSLNAQLQAQASVSRPAPPPAPWSREEVAQVQAVNAAIRELNMPIAALLRALEPPEDMKVAVLSIELDGVATDRSSSIKVVAEAKSGAEMPRYVATLAERRPFSGAYLMRHELNAKSPGSPYQFTLEAQWSD